MKLKQPVIVGALCMALGLSAISLAANVDNNANSNADKKAQSKEAKVNDYSAEGAEYDGPRPEHQIKKGFRDSAEAEVPNKASPVVNDYSSMGEEYGKSQGENDGKGKNAASSITVGPVVNDYSDMDAEYGASTDSTQEVDTSQASAGRLQPANLTEEDRKVGYEKYHGNCAQCHGEDAVGSTFAPSLLTRLDKLDYPGFVDVVTNGKTVFDSATGGYSVMPAWNNNPEVMSHLDQLWAYLKARSDGELGIGRPQ